jgi:hypothetical protein
VQLSRVIYYLEHLLYVFPLWWAAYLLCWQLVHVLR